jgi:hypothetical protein
MFAQVLADFDDRVVEVNLFFQLLKALDNEEIVIGPGAGPQVFPPGPPPENWGRMLKGAAYLVLYNLVEAFVRRGFQTVFDVIRCENVCGTDLTENFRRQWMSQRYRRIQVIDGSPKQYMDIADEIIQHILEQKTASMGHRSLPLSGNIDADAIREVFDLHGVDSTTPPETRGGDSLKIVKTKRNALAHGDESFAECGRQLTAEDLVTAKDEVVMYMRSILDNLQSFTESKGYKSSQE